MFLTLENLLKNMMTEFKYYELNEEEKKYILKKLREILSIEEEIVFAYVHGGFIERSFFRDIDVAVWIKSLEKAFYYTVNYSVKLEIKIGYPVDVHVLNEAPLPFKYHVFTRGKLLFSKDEYLRSLIVNTTIREYLDFKLLEKLVLKESTRVRRP